MAESNDRQVEAPPMALAWGSYLKTTSNLTPEQFGAYMLLVARYWCSGVPLPDDDDVLASIARLSPEVWAQHRPVIERQFQVGDGVWRDAKLDDDIAAARRRTEAFRAAGRATARKRWATRTGSQASDSGATDQVTHSLASQARSPLIRPSQATLQSPPTVVMAPADSEKVVGAFLRWRAVYWPDASPKEVRPKFVEFQAAEYLTHASAVSLVKAIGAAMRELKSRGGTAPRYLRTIHQEILQHCGTEPRPTTVSSSANQRPR